jgi:hypothetical protein
MSKENSEIALQQIEALDRRDVDAFIALVSPDVDGRTPSLDGACADLRRENGAQRVG